MRKPPIISLDSQWQHAVEQLMQSSGQAKADIKIRRDRHWRTSRRRWHNSFIRINDCILRMGGPDDTVGRGGFGRVKWVQKRSGLLSVVKITRDDNHHTREMQILQDLNRLNGMATRNGKRYLWQNYRGKSLHQVTFSNSNERLTIACRLIQHVHDLHQGKLSRSATRYFHNDIKPKNITIDRHGRPWLIDFDLTSSTEFPEISGGTHGYMAPELHAGSGFSAKTDCYALGVTLTTVLSSHQTSPATKLMTSSNANARPALPWVIVDLLCQRYAHDANLLRQALHDHNAIITEPTQAKALAALLAASSSATPLATTTMINTLPRNSNLCRALACAYDYLNSGRFGWLRSHGNHGKNQAKQFIRNLCTLPHASNLTIRQQMQQWLRGYGRYGRQGKLNNSSRLKYILQSGLFGNAASQHYASATTTERRTMQDNVLASAPLALVYSRHGK